MLMAEGVVLESSTLGGIFHGALSARVPSLQPTVPHWGKLRPSSSFSVRAFLQNCLVDAPHAFKASIG